MQHPFFPCVHAASTAQERVLSPERASGYDGVITQCVTLTREQFANDMCAPLATSVAGMASKAGLARKLQPVFEALEGAN